MGFVRGVLIDESVLYGAEDEYGKAVAKEGIEYLLRKLQYSGLKTGVRSRSRVAKNQAFVIELTREVFRVDLFDTIHSIKEAWEGIGDDILYLVSKSTSVDDLKIGNSTWTIVVLDDGGASVDETGIMRINRLEELPLTICRINKKALGGHVITVGYVMKPSRELDFAKRGAFPLFPSQNGLIFLPLNFKLPVASQIQEADMILEKATDEIVSIELNGPSSYPYRITFSEGFTELLRCVEANRDCCVLDSVNSIYPVLDRLAIQKILQGLEDLEKKIDYSIRAPRFVKVDNFSDPELPKRLIESSVSFPCIVKPRVACGVADAHSMAIAFRFEELKNLPVPVPAVIQVRIDYIYPFVKNCPTLQEYVNHSSTIFKFYVLGKKVFYATKKSTPSAETLMKLSEQNGFQPLLFDSLKSLPITQSPSYEASIKSSTDSLDLDLVTTAAAWLRNKLGLTIIGFDVVIQEGTRDHVIVDVNYLPSFKEVPDSIAMPAFWDAIKQQFEIIKTNQQN